MKVKISVKGGKIIFDRNGAVVPINYLIKNTGNTPANKVSFHAWLIPFISHSRNIFDEQISRCDRLRGQPFGIGPTIFPNEQFPLCNNYISFGAGASWEEIEYAIRDKKNYLGRQILFCIVGCLDYTFPTDTARHHQTPFIFYLTPTVDVPIFSEREGNIIKTGHSLIKADMTGGPGAD